MPLVCMVYVQYAGKVKQVDFIDITTKVRSSDEIHPKSMKTGNLEWHKVQGTDVLALFKWYDKNTLWLGADL